MSSGMKGKQDEREKEGERAPVSEAGGQGSLPPLSLDFSSVCGGIMKEKGAGSFENTRVVAGVARCTAIHQCRGTRDFDREFGYPPPRRYK